MRIALRESDTGADFRLDDRTGLVLRSSGLVVANPALADGWWTIAPAGRVGVARIGEVELSITPKLDIRRLFFLLGYAADDSAWRDEDVRIAQAPDLLVAVADAFARQAERATAQGLLQGYRVVEEARPVLRGRIRMMDQLARRYALPVPLEVRYDEFDTDIAENRLLRTATERLLALPGVRGSARRVLLRLLRSLADVTPLTRGEPLPALVLSRLNARYHVALRLAELVLRGQSVEQGDGAVHLDGFMIDMAGLFEDFVERELGSALSRIGGRCKAQDTWFLDDADAVRMKLDLVWYREGREPTAVIDAKYKADKSGRYPNADLYQMLAYCMRTGLRDGHLVYAKGNDPETAHRVIGVDVEIHQHALDLDVEPPELVAQVDGIARRIHRLAVPELRYESGPAQSSTTAHGQ